MGKKSGKGGRGPKLYQESSSQDAANVPSNIQRQNDAPIQSEQQKPAGALQARHPITSVPTTCEAPLEHTQALPKPARVKKTYRNLFTFEQGQAAVLLPGRNPCDCEARKHKLINNCLKCGRIVCAQEGSGPCFHCGEMVCTNEEFDVLRRDDSGARQLRKRLAGFDEKAKGRTLADASAALGKAMEDRDRLVQYDRENAQRTKVIDDQTDYFSYEDDKYMTPAQRREAQQKRKEMMTLKNMPRSQMPMSMNISMATGTMSSGNSSDALKQRLEEMRLEGVQRQEAATMKQREKERKANERIIEEEEDNPEEYYDIQFNLGMQKTMPALSKRSIDPLQKFTSVNHHWQRNMSRVQVDSTGGGCLQSSNDLCLTVRQPFASFIVLGIKRYEGRSWYTEHRGLLWIASAAKQNDPNDDIQLEKLYAQLYKKQNGLGEEDPDCVFPERYPVSSLLGCVDVIDCVPQEIFRQTCPDCEVDDPYVWVLGSPRELPLAFPISCKGGLFKLEPEIASVALRIISA